MVEVITEREFDEWYEALQETDQDSVTVVIDMLEMMGVVLPFPWSSEFKESKYALRELRPKAGASPQRVFYGFDERRRAVVLLGASKATDKKFYSRMARLCDRIWERHIAGKCEGEE